MPFHPFSLYFLLFCLPSRFSVFRVVALFQHTVESRDQRLGEPEGEDELGASHEQLGDETLEEGSHTLVLGHVGQDAETALGVLKVAVLNTGLDDIEGSGDDEGGRGTGDGGDKVLEPGGLVVVIELEEELLGKGRTTEQGEGTGGVAGGGPSPAAVQAETLVGDDLEDTTAAEGLGVGLTLDLEDVQGQENDLTDTDQTVFHCKREAGRGVYGLGQKKPTFQLSSA